MLVGSDVPPATPVLWQRWWDTVSGTEFVWYPNGGTPCWVPATAVVRGADGAPGADGADGVDGAPGPAGLPAPIFTAVLNVTPMAYGYAEVVVASAGISAASKVPCWLVAELDAENDVEELADNGMAVFAVPETNQVRFVLTGTSAFVGTFKVNYQIG